MSAAPSYISIKNKNIDENNVVHGTTAMYNHLVVYGVKDANRGDSVNQITLDKSVPLRRKPPNVENLGRVYTEKLANMSCTAAIISKRSNSSISSCNSNGSGADNLISKTKIESDTEKKETLCRLNRDTPTEYERNKNLSTEHSFRPGEIGGANNLGIINSPLKNVNMNKYCTIRYTRCTTLKLSFTQDDSGCKCSYCQTLSLIFVIVWTSVNNNN